MLRILFFGLCMFVKNHDGRTVVIPDLTSGANVLTPRGATCVEPHIAYISAPKGAVALCIGCESHIDAVSGQERMVLYLKGDAVTISGLTGAFNEAPDYDKTIPPIETYCPQFRLSIPATASTLPLKNGNLKAARVDHVSHSILEDTPDGDVTIEVSEGSVVRSMVINKPPEGTTIEIEISNRYAAGHFQNPKKVPALAENHWLAFYTLSATPVICDLPTDATTGLLETTLACSNSGYP